MTKENSISAFLSDDGTLDTVILVKEIDGITGQKINQQEFRYQFHQDSEFNLSYENFVLECLIDAVEQYKDEKMIDTLNS